MEHGKGIESTHSIRLRSRKLQGHTLLTVRTILNGMIDKLTRLDSLTLTGIHTLSVFHHTRVTHRYFNAHDDSTDVTHVEVPSMLTILLTFPP
jgi:hypothetical protein